MVGSPNTMQIYNHLCTREELPVPIAHISLALFNRTDFTDTEPNFMVYGPSALGLTNVWTQSPSFANGVLVIPKNDKDELVNDDFNEILSDELVLVLLDKFFDTVNNLLPMIERDTVFASFNEFSSKNSMVC